MKRILSFFAAILFAGTMMAGVGNVFYEAVFKKGTSAGGDNISGYASSGSYTTNSMTWTIPGNNTNGDYIRIGGKGIESAERVIQSQDAMAGDIAKIVINHNGISRKEIVVDSVKLTVASDAAFSENVETSKYVPESPIEKSIVGTIEFLAADKWSAGSYYQFSFFITNSSNSNGGLDVASISFYSYQDASAASINAANVDFGMLSTTSLPYTMSQDLEVTGANLTDAITYSVTGTHTTVAGELTANGGTLTVLIAAETEGEFEDFIVLSSGSAETTVSVKANIVKTDGDGSEDNPFSVADVVKLNNQLSLSERYWVKGYIVGCAANSGLIGPDTETNVALGDAAEQTENVIPVALPSGAVRSDVNIVNNPSNKGRLIKVHGQLNSYFLFTGVKETDQYEFLSEPSVIVAKPVFAPEAETFDESVEVTLTCATEGADILYTLDGTDPDASSTVYNGAFTLTETTTVKAIAFFTGISSAIVEKTYTKNEPVVLDNGYYLIGQNGWDVAALSANLLFAENPSAAGEWMLTTTLAENEGIKVVKVEDGAITTWYPEGMGNEYVVDAAHAGEKTIYFKPDGDSEWAAFGGYIFIEKNAEQPGNTVTFKYEDYKGEGTQSSGSEYTMSKENIVSINDTKFFGNNSYAHSYANGVITVTPAAGVTVTKVVITASSTSYNGYQSNGTVTASAGEISVNNSLITWAGSANKPFTISHDKQIRWLTIEVTYEQGGETVVLESLEIGGDLDVKSYYEGKQLNFSGLTVTGNYSDNSTEDLTNGVTWAFEPALTADVTEVTVTAAYGELSATKVITGITVEAIVVAPGTYDIPMTNALWGTNYEGTAAGVTEVSAIANGIEITANKGTGTSSFYINNTETRLYGGYSLVFSVPAGYVITSLEFTQGGSWSCSANEGTLNGQSWTGSENSVSFTFTGRTDFQAVSVTYEEKLPLVDGYYLIGQKGWDVNALNANLLFAVNPENADELLLTTTLVAGQEIKVVEVANEAITNWYPNAGDNYMVDKDHAGDAKTIYFNPAGNSEWTEFGGYIFIEKNPESNVLYVWDGVGSTTAAIEEGGEAKPIPSDNGNIVVGAGQKGNWCLKVNKGFSSDGGPYYIGIALDKAVNAGDTIEIAFFRTGTDKSFVMGMDFNADKDNVSTTYQLLTEGDPQALTSNGTPVDSTYIVPQGVEDAKYIRIYRNSGSTGLWVAKVRVLKNTDTPYFLKNNWNGEVEKSWKRALRDTEGLYHLKDVVFGGDGVNYNTSMSDEGAGWVAVADFKGDNTITALDTVDLALDPTAGTITVSNVREYVAPVVTHTYTVAGSASLFGAEWDPTKADNDMTLDSETGLYVWAKEDVTLSAGTVEFKVCEDYAWTTCWPSSNYELSISEDGSYDVKITFNPDSKEVSAVVTMNGAVVIPKTAAAKGSWDEWANEVAFTVDAAEETAVAVMNLTAAGTYEFKMIINGDQWRSNAETFSREKTSFEGISENNTSNMFLVADAAGDYTFTWTFESNKLEITFPAAPEPTYYLKNNWGEAEWTWKETDLDANDGLYHLNNVIYGGTGINYNTIKADEGPDYGWIEHKDITLISNSKAPVKLEPYDVVNLAFDPVAKSISAEMVTKDASVYTVVGSSTAIFYTEWDANHPYNDMEKLSDGTYQLKKEDITLPIGTVTFNVAKNHDTDRNNWILAEDYVLNITESAVYDLTFTFSPVTMIVDVIALKKADINIENMALAGSWNGWSDRTNLIMDVSSEKLEATLTLTAGEDYQFKLVSAEDAWFGNSEVFTRDNASHRDIKAVGGTDNNMKLVADADGDYIFTWIFATQQLRISFPAVVPDTKIAALNGEFSVSADKKVNFSRGNLQYNYGADAWYAAEKQYDVLGDFNLRLGDPTYTGSVDLLGWSCESSNFGLLPSFLNTDYNGDFVDWGANFTGNWRTLSKEEWLYLFNNRKDAANNKLWAVAAVGPDSIIGMILFPDDWTAPTGIEINYGYYDLNDEINLKAYTLAEWATLEQANAVFLPAGGSRAGAYGNNIGRDGLTPSTTTNPLSSGYCFVDYTEYAGYYWTSTPDSRAGYENFAGYTLLPTFHDNVFYSPEVWSRERPRGNSVRLVTEVIPPTYTVAGESTSVFAHAWDWTDADFDMTLQADGSYTKTLSNIQLGIGTYEYKVFENHDTEVSYPIVEGNVNASFSIDREAYYNITFVYYPANAFPDVPLNENCEAIVQFVESLPSAQIKGSWEPWVTPAMTLEAGNETAVYTRFLEAKTYTFTIISNGDKYGKGQEFSISTNSYTDIPNGSGMKLHATIAGNYTFRWNFNEKSLVITFPPSEDVYNVVGSASVFGVDWGVNSETNQMILNSDGVTYSLLLENVTLPKDKYEFKIVKNHDWDGSVPEYDNADFTIFPSGVWNILFTLNPTAVDEDDKYSVTLTLVEEKEVQPKIEMKGSWNNWGPAVELTKDNDEEASYTMKMQQSATSYQFKMLINGNYRSTGGYITESSPSISGITENLDANMSLSIPETGIYTFTWKYATNTLIVSYPSATAIDETEAEGAKVMKMIKDNQVLIIRDGKTFNVLGTLVK